MAFSKSTNIKMAQHPKDTCSGCQDNSEVFWNCDECKIAMCLTCGEKHITDKKFQDHRVVNKKDGMPILKPIKCSLSGHTKQNISIFCQDCESFLCTKCLVENNHKTHLILELDNVYSKNFTKLDEHEKQLKEDFEKFFTEEINILQKMKESHLENYENQKLKIKENDKILKSAITAQTNHILANLESDWELVQSEIQTQMDKIQIKIKEIKNMLTAIKKRKKTNDIYNIYKLSRQVKDFVENIDLSHTPLPISSRQFVQDTSLLQHNLNKLFGILQPLCLTSADLIHFKRLRSYITDLTSVYSIKINNDDGTIWIGSFWDNVFKKIKLSTYQLITIEEKKNIELWDIAITNNGDLLMAINNSPCIKLLTKDDEIQELYKFTSKGWFSKPQVPVSFHAQQDDTILIGTMEQGGDLYTLSDSSNRQVVLLSQDYTILETYEFDQKGNRLFTCPRRISSGFNRDIYVLDSLNFNTGRVVTLNKTGDIRWTYTGNHSRFKPWDITTTPNHNIISCDRYDSSIHILNYDGHLIKHLETKYLDIFSPISLDIDQKGQLYVGCQHNQAKIHILSFTGC